MRPWICQSCRYRRKSPQTIDHPPKQLTSRANSSNARRARRKALQEDRSNPGRKPAPDLPRPPFMRTPTITPDRFAWVPYTNGPPPANSKQTRLARLDAPFATAFAENPYAQALTTPVRECTFTGARLPRALLMDFHVVDEDDPLGAGSLAGRLQMLPLSLAAQLVPRKKDAARQTEAEREAVRRWDEEKDSNVPRRASYVVVRKAALDFVSARPDKRVLSHAMSARMQLVLGNERRKDKVQWRKDMPAIVLEGLRRLLWKRLRFFMRSKGRADKDSLVQGLSSEWGMRAIHDVDNVGCVLRLREPDKQEPVKAESPVATRYTLRQQGSSAADEGSKAPEGQVEGSTGAEALQDSEESANSEEDEGAALEEVDEARLGEDDEALLEESNGSEESDEAAAFDEETLQDSEESVDPEESDEGVLEADDESPAHTQLKQLANYTESEERQVSETELSAVEVESASSEAEQQQLGSETWQEHEGTWSSRQTKTTPFMDGIRPLAPPHQPMHMYFPTIRYRNHRVPLYSLPQLLGDKYTAMLLEDTVFASGVKYAAVKFGPGTMELQQQLLKLHAFFADGKGEAAKI